MPPITSETPRKNIRVAGIILSAPTPYAEGHVLTANEAAAINQTYLENLGNNFRTRAEQFIRAAIAGLSASEEEIKAVTKEQINSFLEELDDNQSQLPVADIQKSFDEAVAAYEFGVRRTSSVEVIDPVTREARSLAKEMLKTALKKKGIKLNTVSADWYDREIGKLLAPEHPKSAGILKDAKRRVAIAQQASTEALDDLDFDGIEKAATEESTS